MNSGFTPLFEYMDDKFASLENRLDSVEGRLDNLQTSVDGLARQVLSFQQEMAIMTISN